MEPEPELQLRLELGPKLEPELEPVPEPEPEPEPEPDAPTQDQNHQLWRRTVLLNRAALLDRTAAGARVQKQLDRVHATRRPHPPQRCETGQRIKEQAQPRTRDEPLRPPRLGVERAGGGACAPQVPEDFSHSPTSAPPPPPEHSSDVERSLTSRMEDARQLALSQSIAAWEESQRLAAAERKMRAMVGSRAAAARICGWNSR